MEVYFDNSHTYTYEETPDLKEATAGHCTVTLGSNNDFLIIGGLIKVNGAEISTSDVYKLHWQGNVYNKDSMNNARAFHFCAKLQSNKIIVSTFVITVPLQYSAQRLTANVFAITFWPVNREHVAKNISLWGFENKAT